MWHLHVYVYVTCDMPIIHTCLQIKFMPSVLCALVSCHMPGKSLTTIGLILANPPMGRVYAPPTTVPVKEEEEEGEKEKEEDEGALLGAGADLSSGYGASTLIVCPLSVLSAWQMQFSTHVKAGVLRLQLFHGPQRAREEASLQGSDVILTTYEVLVSEMSSARDSACGSSSGSGGSNNKKLKQKKRKAGAHLPGVLEGMRFHRVILDEGKT